MAKTFSICARYSRTSRWLTSSSYNWALNFFFLAGSEKTYRVYPSFSSKRKKVIKHFLGIFPFLISAGDGMKSLTGNFFGGKSGHRNSRVFCQLINEVLERIGKRSDSFVSEQSSHGRFRIKTSPSDLTEQNTDLFLLNIEQSEVITRSHVTVLIHRVFATHFGFVTASVPLLWFFDTGRKFLEIQKKKPTKTFFVLGRFGCY